MRDNLARGLNTRENEKELSEPERNIMRTLAYFDIFRHPLTAHELRQCNPIAGITAEATDRGLQRLQQLELVYEISGFYQLSPNPQTVARRIEGNQLASHYLKYALRISSWIGQMPFVRGVMISGSLSKGYMDKGSDIDYFIITEKGRLWLCRTLLAAVRKVLPGRLKKYYCINYFIDNGAFAIPDQNLFVATELAFIRPTYNLAIYQELISANTWIRDFYPNKNELFTDVSLHARRGFVKRAVEKIFSGWLGEKLDTFFFKFMLRRWQKRYKNFDVEQFDLNIRTRKNVSKQHEKGHQTLILTQFENKIKELEVLHQVKLSND